MSYQAAEIGAFESAVRSLVSQAEDNPADVRELVTAAFAELASSSLPADEVTRRSRRITGALPADSRTLGHIAEAAAGSSPAVRAAVVAALPPEFQRQAYSLPVTEDAATDSDEGDSGVAAQETEPDAPALELPRPDAEVAVPAEASDDWRTVLLLGSRQDVESNQHFLEERGFKAVRITTIDRLTAALGERCCAVVVHQSWWQQFGDAQQAAHFVRERLRLANILYYRFDTDGLGAASVEVGAVLASLDPAVRARVQTGAGCSLSELDLEECKRVAGLLNSADAAAFGIEGVSEAERRLLTTAVALFENEDRGRVPTGTGDILIEPLADGRSAAKVLRIRIEDRPVVFVAKLDEVPRLEEELQRARLVVPGGQPVAMRLYSLAGTGVLVQQLLPNLDGHLRAAMSLKERLAMRAAWERGRRAVTEPLLADLEVGIDRMIEAVREINSSSGAGHSVNCWMAAEPFDFLAEFGVRYAIDDGTAVFDPADDLGLVQSKLSELAGSCLVHGDLHTGNVLMLDDRTPRLIDFAYAGAGHPCFDLVRVSSAIAYAHIRPVHDEPTLREFFARVHLGGDGTEVLYEAFPTLMASGGARLAARALVRAREACFAALGGPDAETQYLGMVFLIGAQSLTMDDFQGSTARAALAAIRSRIRDLADV